MLCCYVLKRFPRLSQTFVLEELLELQRQGVELAVIARDGSGGPTVPRADLLVAPVELLPVGADGAFVAERLAALGATHVHAHFAGWAATITATAAAKAGLPYSFTAHATDIYRDGIDEVALADRIAGARAVVTVTEANRLFLENLLARHQRTGRIVRIYNGVDTARLAPVFDGREDGLVLGIGRLVPKKGHHVLIDAIRRLRDRNVAVHLQLVGEGPLQGDLEQQIASSGLEGAVSLLGARPHNEVLDLLRRCTVFALPSTIAVDGDRDALPTVITEAMALGAPVVATAVSGIPEQVDSGNTGLLVAPDNPGALADALQLLLSDNSLRRRFALAGRARAEARFDIVRSVATLRAVFAE
jgi:colanic acid/amylovoran biosynthesis glycosyltransferase